MGMVQQANNRTNCDCKSNRLNDMIYFIDAGHGPETQGKQTPSYLWKRWGFGVKEFSANRRIARRLEDKLKNDGHVIIRVYAENRDTKLDERCEIANSFIKSNVANSCLISIHHNAYEDISANGMEVHIATKPSQTSVEIAEAIKSEAAMRLSGVRMRKDFIKKSNFKILRSTKMPAVLLEAAYMTNKSDVVEILSDRWADKISDILYHALNKTFNPNE